MSAEDTINSLLKLAVENEASDIHIKSEKPGILRLNGVLQEVDMDPVSSAEARDFIAETVPYKFKEDWEHNGQIDYSYSISGIGRFRVNGFFQRGSVSIVFRHVKDQAPTFDDLNISNAEVLESLCQLKDGIVLICGATGSGKSSTLASMMNWINNNLNRHIDTLEDPIEFNFDDRKSVFNQREIGIDAPSFSQGMRAVLRQDPDIILIGEMHDKTTSKLLYQLPKQVIWCYLLCTQRLVQEGPISKNDALKFSPNAKALEMNLKGIFLSTRGIVS